MRKKDELRREDYERGLPGHHDVLARLTGAPSGLSALTLRLWLAGFGFAFCVVVAVVLPIALPELGWLAWVLGVLALIAAIDFGWVLHRKLRGEPG